MFRKSLLLFLLPVFIFSQKIEVCGNNGFYTFSEDELKTPVKQDLENLTQDVWAIYLSDYFRGIQKISNVDTTPTLEIICEKLDNDYAYFHELAINSKGEVYLSTDLPNEIKKVNLDNCSTTTIPINFSDYIHAMSFDTADNLYISTGSDGYPENRSIVYRADADNLSHFYPWHDFGNGYAGGDMVMLNGKMYIAWVSPTAVYRLYEVEVDSDFRYISHKDLGEIKNQTHGLAAEFGKIYGVTPRIIYEINIQDLSTRDIITSPFQIPRWFGMAGRHEAVILDYNFHNTQSDAEAGRNPITFPYTNQTANQQTVYLRIFGKNSDQTIKVVPIDLIIKNAPIIDLKNHYKICQGEPINIELNSHLSPDEYDFQWFLNDISLNQNSPKITANALGKYSVKATSKTNDCDAQAETEISESRIQITSVNHFGGFLDIMANGTDAPFLFNFGNGWQTSSRTSEYQYGKFVVFAKNNLGCTANYDLFLPPTNVITPNNDGINDFWSFEYSEDEIVGQITIVDRFGKIILQSETGKNFRWYGDYNGQKVPTGTYWYSVSINENIKFSGFILVKHRN